PFLTVTLGAAFFLILVVREADQSFANVYSTAVSIQNLAPRTDRRVLSVGLGVFITQIGRASCRETAAIARAAVDGKEPRPEAQSGFQAEDGIRGFHVTGVQTCALPICPFLTVTLGAAFFLILVVREADQSFANVYSTAVSIQNLAHQTDRPVLSVGLGVFIT